MYRREDQKGRKEPRRGFSSAGEGEALGWLHCHGGWVWPGANNYVSSGPHRSGNLTRIPPPPIFHQSLSRLRCARCAYP